MRHLLLPYRLKYVGWLLILSGIFLFILYFWFNFRFKLPVFAVYSSFLSTRTFDSIKTNFADETVLLVLILGLGLTIFSKEKIETEQMDSHRTKALGSALFTNFIFLLFSILFIYGSGFISVLVMNTISMPVFYLIHFNYLNWRKK